jgi:GT2 family glycosyltransferase
MAPTRCSIIIPVHNKAALTRQCLDSIFANPPTVGFEVIVVDDASSDSTQEMLASHGDRVRAVRLDKNAGFAGACNTGAAAAKGDYLVFLNNDTIAEDGWLDELAGYADEHPAATAVGSRLLFPDRTVQHAGVVFSLSGDPLHIYVGFPPEHPAVMKSRRFQAVTAACLLIRRDVFDELGGFDTDYQNDLEDVDLCLRLGELGYEVHYCHTSVLYHLESASRASRFHEGRSAKLYRERWRSRVRSDEFDYYAEDGLLDLLRRAPDPAAKGDDRRQEAEVLQIRSRQMLELLRAAIRSAGSATGTGSRGRRRLGSRLRSGSTPAPAGGRRRGVSGGGEGNLASLRSTLAGPLGGFAPEAPSEEQAPQPIRPRAEGYAGVVADVIDVVQAVVPAGSTVLVASKGDDKLVDLPGRSGWHFPRGEDGRYRGYYPADDDDAIAHLDELRDRGAEFLVLPSTAFWWLDHYPGFGDALRERHRATVATERCKVFDLRPQHSIRTVDAEISREEYATLVRHIKRIVEAVVPPEATVLVVSKGDDKLVDLPGRRGWHFPRDQDGRYRGYYPADSDDAIAQLDELHDRGAEFLVLPATAFWWLDHYPRFAERLRDRHALAWLENCAVFDLRTAAEVSGAASPAAVAAPSAAPQGTGVGAEALTEPQYGDLVERVQSLVSATVPAGATVLVISKGDDKLVDLPGRHGWHFPRARDGRYAGYYPETDDDAIAHLEELRSQGAQYLVFPSTSFWWLDHYPQLAGHLRSRYGTGAYDHDTAQVFELWEPLLPAVVKSLLPGDSRLAVLSPFGADLAGLGGYRAVQLSAATTEAGIEELDRLVAEGVEFLVIPRSSFVWHEEHFELAQHLEANHRFVTRQRHAGEIWQLEPTASADDRNGKPAEQASETTAATAEAGKVPGGEQGDAEPAPKGPVSRIFRLLWKKQGV